ncbi:MAG TPA: HAD-IC family P-type ATPase, partial [Thermomicrobiales bacterium]|nr:HAD-IC family P-type ATPase [Thermomicrobiales bacterium]
TRGEPELTDVVSLVPVIAGPGSRPDDDAVVRWAAIAEAGSGHPLARPVVQAAEARLGELPQMPESSEAVIGQGVQAMWDGHRIAVGTPDLIARNGMVMAEGTSESLRRFQNEGKTAMLVGVDREVIGVLAVQDTAREGMVDVVARLGANGVKRVAMLTGDNEATARRIAETIGTPEVHARLLPDDKLAWIREAQAGGDVVAMVGDGVNDAPALATADIGIAMGAAGSDVALETADVALMTDQPERIVDALRISRKTVGIIRQNLAIALVTVALLLAGVLAGEVDMAGGMLIHELSVLVVILNGMRLMRA